MGKRVDRVTITDSGRLEVSTVMVVDAWELARNCDRSELIEFVKYLDDAMGWDFTIQLYKYFDEKRKEYEQECKEGGVEP